MRLIERDSNNVAGAADEQAGYQGQSKYQDTQSSAQPEPVPVLMCRAQQDRSSAPNSSDGTSDNKRKRADSQSSLGDSDDMQADTATAPQNLASQRIPSINKPDNVYIQSSTFMHMGAADGTGDDASNGEGSGNSVSDTITLQIQLEGSEGHRPLEISSLMSMQELKQAACSAWGLDNTACSQSLLYLPDHNTVISANDMQETVRSQLILDNQVLQLQMPQGQPSAHVEQPNTSPQFITADIDLSQQQQQELQSPSPDVVSPSRASLRRNRLLRGEPKQLTFRIVCEDKEDEKQIHVANNVALGDLKRQACEAHAVASSDYMLYDYFNQAEGDNFEQGKMHLRLEHLRFADNQHLLLRKKDATPKAAAAENGEEEDVAAANISSLFDGTDNNEDDSATLALEYSPYSRPAIQPNYTTNYGVTTRSGMTYGSRPGGFNFNLNEDTAQPAPGRAPGVAGFSNLGNTCFMNSSLQALAHTPALLDAFLSGKYLADLNTTNPLGMQGELAQGFGQLMQLLWQGDVSHVTPRKFKERIGRFAPQFSGYAQHDSQEFLAFLLDGLHEDLNRIKNKPYIEEPDNAGRPEHELATEAWVNYRARNDSTIVDHFQGLYKSRLDCPTCGFTSIKFDPFMYLTLPLPESRMRQLPVTVVALASSRPPVKVIVSVANAGTVKDVQVAVWKLLAPDLTVEGHLWALESTQPAMSKTSDMSTSTTEGGAVFHSNNATDRAGNTDGVTADGGIDQPPPMLCVKLIRSYGNHQEDVEIFGNSCRVTEIAPNTKSFNKELLVMYMYPPAEIQAALASYAASAAASIFGTDQQDDQANGSVPIIDMSNNGNEDQNETPAPIAVSDPLSATAHTPAQNEVPQADGDSTAAAPLVLPFGLPYQAGTIPVIVHHRIAPKTLYGRGTMLMVPLILWLPPSYLPHNLEDGDLQLAVMPGLHQKKEWGVYGRLRALITGAVASALISYRTLAGITADEASQSDAVPISSVPENRVLDGDVAAQDGGIQGHHMADAQTNAPAEGASTTNTCKQHHNQDAAGVNGRIDPPHSTIQDDAHASQSVVALTPSNVGNEQFTQQQQQQSTSPFAASGPPAQPFDMWAVQNQQQQQVQAGIPTIQQPVNEAAGSTVITGPGFKLVAADARGNTDFYGIKTPLSEACDTDPPLWHLLCDWSPDAGNRWDMSLMESNPIDHASVAAHAAAQQAGKAPVSLQDCVQAFLQPEQLSQDDSWYCPRCKQHVQADKKLDLWALPNTLVVHLKRFSYTRYSRDKLDTHVDFPELLDLSPYLPNHTMADKTADCTQPNKHNSTYPQSNGTGTCDVADYVTNVQQQVGTANGSMSDTLSAVSDMQQEPLVTEPDDGVQPFKPVAAIPTDNKKFRLFAVVNHFGSLGGGHYTAHARMPGKDEWYLYDDSSAHAVQQHSVVSPAAYLLFYRSISAEETDPPDLLQHLLSQRNKAIPTTQLDGTDDQDQGTIRAADGVDTVDVMDNSTGSPPRYRGAADNDQEVIMPYSHIGTKGCSSPAGGACYDPDMYDAFSPTPTGRYMHTSSPGVANDNSNQGIELQGRGFSGWHDTRGDDYWVRAANRASAANLDESYTGNSEGSLDGQMSEKDPEELDDAGLYNQGLDEIDMDQEPHQLHNRETEEEGQGSGDDVPANSSITPIINGRQLSPAEGHQPGPQSDPANVQHSSSGVQMAASNAQEADVAMQNDRDRAQAVEAFNSGFQQVAMRSTRSTAEDSSDWEMVNEKGATTSCSSGTATGAEKGLVWGKSSSSGGATSSTVATAMEKLGVGTDDGLSIGH